MEKWKLSGGSILEFDAPIKRADGTTKFNTKGEGVLCLENHLGLKSYLTLTYAGSDLINAEGVAIEGNGLFQLADLDGNEIFGSMQLDTRGVNNESLNSVVLTMESGNGKFRGINGVIPFNSRVTPSTSDTRYFCFVEGEGSARLGESR